MTTGIYGLAVHHNPRPELLSLYSKILHKAERMPETSVYRKSVEAITRQRLSIVEAEASVSKIEQTIDNGQIEELIQQAEDELNLISLMERHKVR
ncbi:ndufa5, NADH-ubiquinone oxidoreductase subunit [Phlyctochytrium bullatum]|nr:ndufa5, NADH-ubiquinone oxidoreductase subunit [Phlyctochytrium bullatum]